MVVTIHQPDFLPWLGFFDRWHKSDLFIVLDDVQFIRRGWQHRDKIKTKDGATWLTVPVVKKGRYDQLIRDVKIDNETNWRDKHLKSIKSNYKKAPNFEDCFKGIKEIYEKNHLFLIDLNMDFLHLIADKLGIPTPFVFASDYHIKTTSTQRLLDLVKSVDGSAYLTGLGSQGYLDKSLFHKEKIKLVCQKFQHPVYKQLHEEFIPMLSCLDYLMMETNPCKLLAEI